MTKSLRALLIGGMCLLSCSRAKKASSDVAPEPERGTPDQEVQPVYGAAADDPVASKLCEALQMLPKRARARCCHTGTGVVLVGECVRNLSAAMQSKALSLDTAAVDRCVAAMNQLYGGCDWIGPVEPEPPSECRNLLVGHHKAGEACASSFECTGRLHCIGAGPTAKGRCGPAGSVGFPCGLGVDVIDAYLRQGVEESHPECEGYCERRQCQPSAADGAACVASRQCGAGQRCAQGHCATGATAKLGESCSGGDCEPGARCILGKCALPKPSGEPCTIDAECRGGCVKHDAGAGTCATRCDLR
jgi:hypothetical protein